MTNKQIVNAVSTALNIPYEQLKSKDRHRDVSDARSIAVALILKNTDITLKKLGAQFNRHHSTLIHSREKYDELRERDINYALKADACLDLLK